MKKSFNSAYSTLMIVSTVILLVCLIYIIYYAITGIVTGTKLYIHIPVLVIVLFTLIYAIANRIRSIEITDDSVYIHLGFYKKIISRKDILNVRAKGKIIHDIRVLGISGIFGHLGLFKDKSGMYTSYVSNEDDAILIETKNKRYAVSCKNREDLIALLSN